MVAIQQLNQQLAWCKTLLSTFACNVEQQRQPWQQEMLAQSLCWHLNLAYCAFLTELTISQNLSVAGSVSSVQQLIAALPAGRAVPLEFDELSRLELGQGWLAALRSLAVDPASFLSHAAKAVNANVISTTQAPAADLPLLVEVLEQLQELIERQRTVGIEC